MKLNSRYVSTAALAAAIFLTVAGCKSNTQQATDQNAQNPQLATDQNAQSPQQATSADQGTAAAPGAPARNMAAAPRPVSPAAPSAGRPAPQASQQSSAIDLPVGTQLHVRLDEALGSKISQPGDAFSATVADDVVVNGRTVIAKGSRADGTVVDAQPLGKLKGGALLKVQLEHVGSYPVQTSSISQAEQGKGKRSLVMGGGGAAIGALIGGLTGGGKGAAIGAAAGAGAGTAGSAFTGNKQIVLPAETLLTFKLEQPVHITQR